jgi:hypothetical protein
MAQKRLRPKVGFRAVSFLVLVAVFLFYAGHASVAQVDTGPATGDGVAAVLSFTDTPTPTPAPSDTPSATPPPSATPSATLPPSATPSATPTPTPNETPPPANTPPAASPTAVPPPTLPETGTPGLLGTVQSLFLVAIGLMLILIGPNLAQRLRRR